MNTRTIVLGGIILLGIGVAVVPALQAQGVPADIVYENAAFGNTTFKHTTHTEAAGLECTSCHTDRFQMAKGSTEMTMASMMAGEGCGGCHNGTVAFAVGECARCHVKEEAPAPAPAPAP